MNNFQAAIIALGITAAGVAVGISQPTTPSGINGCVAHTVAPSAVTDGVALPFTCDSTGKLRVTTTF